MDEKNPTPTPPKSPDSSSMDSLLTDFDNLHVGDLGLPSLSDATAAASPSNHDSVLWPSCFHNTLWTEPTLRSPFTGGYHHPSLNACGGLSCANGQSPPAMNAGVYDYSYLEATLQLLQDKSIIKLAFTPAGSLVLQDLLSFNDVRCANIIFEGVIGHIFPLMTDQFGHLVFENLIQLCDESQLQIVVENLAAYHDAFIQISLDRYGSPSVKRLIKLLQKSPLVTSLVKILCTGFRELMIHKTGSHVILSCLDILDVENNKLLYEAAVEHAMDLATHQNGCLSLNSFITSVKGDCRNQFLGWVSSNAVCLSKDPYGNFVVQHVLDLHHPKFTREICSNLRNEYAKISMLKGGSRVVEKCLKTSERDYSVTEFINSGQLVQVTKDQFGNYVIQTALRETKRVDSPLHERLVKKLKSHSGALKRGLGKKVLNLIDELESFV